MDWRWWTHSICREREGCWVLFYFRTEEWLACCISLTGDRPPPMLGNSTYTHILMRTHSHISHYWLIISKPEDINTLEASKKQCVRVEGMDEARTQLQEVKGLFIHKKTKQTNKNYPVGEKQTGWLGWAGQGWAGQGWAGLDKAGQGWTRLDTDNI